MLLKVLLVVGLLFQTIQRGSSKQPNKTVSFSVEKIWQSFRTKNDFSELDDDSEWKEGIQQYYDGCRAATKNFHISSYEMANNVVNSFGILVTKLIYFSNSNATVLASSSHAMLESIGECGGLGVSGLTIIKGFDKSVLGLVKQFNGSVAKLSHIIGKLTDSVNDDLNDLGCVLSNFMKKFIRSGASGYRTKVDYEPVLKRFRKLMNTVALIGQTLLNNCELATSEVNEAVTFLTLIVEYFAVAVQGVNTCVQSVLSEHKYTSPRPVLLSSLSLDYVLLEVTRAIDSVVFPFTENISALLTQLVNITLFLNATLKDILGIFEGVAINVGEIAQNLSKSVESTVTGVTMGLTNILKGVVSK